MGVFRKGETVDFVLRWGYGLSEFSGPHPMWGVCVYSFSFFCGILSAQCSHFFVFVGG